MGKAKKLFAVTTTVALTVSLAACGATSGSGSTTTGSESTESLPMTLAVQNDFTKINNLTESTSSELGIAQNVMEGLVRYSQDGKEILPAIAEEWSLSDDQKTYTFTLRDAQWADGTAVTANDFVFAWNTVAKPETAASYASFMEYIDGGAGAGTPDYKGPLNVTAVDDKTLEVTLAEPTPFFLSLLTFPTFFPVSEEFYTTVGADKYGTSADTLLANGPFTISTWDRDQQLVLGKNENYWEADVVSVPSVTFKVVGDESTRVQLFESGELTRMGVSGDYFAQYKDNPGFYTEDDTTIWYLTLNIDNNASNPLLANKNFRQALSHAVNRQVVAEQVFKNGSFPANYVITKGLVANDGTDFRDASFAGNFQTDQETAKAVELFEKAKTETGVTDAKLEISFVESPRNTRLMEVLQEELQKVLPGLTVELRKLPSSSYYDQLAAGDYQVAWAGWGPDYADPSTMLSIFTSTDSHNYGKYNNPEYDKLYAEGLALTGEDEVTARFEKFAEAEKVLIDDQPIIPLMQAASSYVAQPGVSDIVDSAFGGNTGFYKWAKHIAE
ncbi:MAG: peptide ABC transporter substrate-binding protein [Culicoidibacterales bacterium]